MNMFNWLKEHWDFILSVFGGATAAFGTKKAMDQEQNRRLKKLETNMKSVEEELLVINSTIQKTIQSEIKTTIQWQINDLKKDIQTNNILDKQLRSELKDHREFLDKRLDRMELGQSEIIKQQMNFYKEIIGVVKSLNSTQSPL